MTTIHANTVTAAQFLALPEDPEGVRRELVHGEIQLSPSPIPRHSIVDKRLSHLLLQHIEAHDLGELLGDVDTYFNDLNVRRPDIFYFSKARLHLIGAKHIEGPPDLCIEIISPGTKKQDRVDKFKLYAEAGVANYWIIDPASRSAEAYALASGGYKLAAKGSSADIVHFPPFIDLGIPLARLWRVPG